MLFNISRQPLVPAFITLVALAVAAVSGMPGYSDIAQGPAAAATAGGAIPGITSLGTTTAQGLSIDLPHTLLMQLQTTLPGWSKLLGALLIVFTGMCIGRLTVRCNLYSVSSCLAIPLYAIVVCGLPLGTSFLSAFLASGLLALALKNYGAAFCNGYGFDAIFRASAYLGLLVLVLPTALPLLLLAPLAVLLFRRTVREAVVAGFGVMLPTILFCYVNWGADGSFTAPLVLLGSTFITGAPLGLIHQLPGLVAILLIVLLLLSLFAILLFLSDRYNAGTKARLVIIFNICILVLTTAQLCGPAATTELFPMLAIPLAVLLPVMFVRIRPYIALLLYLILLAAALYTTVLQ